MPVLMPGSGRSQSTTATDPISATEIARAVPENGRLSAGPATTALARIVLTLAEGTHVSVWITRPIAGAARFMLIGFSHRTMCPKRGGLLTHCDRW
ncbi:MULTISPECIES: hypothetical protein [Sphingomonas]|uniref:Uncharacterized protein n=1 Tax=Sphingomonas molluscorum TaxID=418184 RepID=A0ABU8PZX7_9SPHN|nr:hypothetical protein [Sphingomonas sp. JUb134]MBM7404539.1 hypothetical protein [Sphingomonas sp. JUb134]